MKSVSVLLFLLMIGLKSFSFAQDADKIRAAFNLSIEEESAKNYDRSIQSIMQVYSESSYEINMRLGWLTFISAKYDESINYYKKASKLKPVSTEALWGLASPLSMKQKWAELNEVYLAIIKNDPKNSLANYYVGLFYYSDKNYAKAKTYFDVSLELNPMDSEICRMSAWTNYFLKNKDAALTLFNRVLMLNQTNSSALEGLTLAKKL